MTAQEAFSPILDSDETIVEVFRPHKFRFVGLGIIWDIIKSLGIAVFGALFFGFSYIDGWVDADTGEPIDMMFGKIVGIVIFSFALLLIIISAVWRMVKYNHTFYCYTNKRIIIRTGFIGADFQNLDFDMIGAMNVRVDFLDKFIHPNTGTLVFASAASPMMTTATPGGISAYMFVDIQNPYDVYRRVKEFVSQNKDGQMNS